MHAVYLISAAQKSQLPKPGLPEVAFIGRSNAGKSSLLNALVNQRDLARKGRTPGRTQMANFFLVNDEHLLVDLPGYGFSKTGSTVRQHWEELVEDCLQRPSLRLVIFLADIRRELDHDDFGILQLLSRNHPPLVVFTKSDKLNRQEVIKRIKHLEHTILREAQISFKGLFAVSNQTKAGIEELRALVFSHS